MARVVSKLCVAALICTLAGCLFRPVYHPPSNETTDGGVSDTGLFTGGDASDDVAQTPGDAEPPGTCAVDEDGRVPDCDASARDEGTVDAGADVSDDASDAAPTDDADAASADDADAASAGDADAADEGDADVIVDAAADASLAE